MSLFNTPPHIERWVACPESVIILRSWLTIITFLITIECNDLITSGILTIRIMINLVSHTIRYGRREGRVIVEVDLEREGLILTNSSIVGSIEDWTIVDSEHHVILNGAIILSAIDNIGIGELESYKFLAISRGICGNVDILINVLNSSCRVYPISITAMKIAGGVEII